MTLIKSSDETWDDIQQASRNTADEIKVEFQRLRERIDLALESDKNKKDMREMKNKLTKFFTWFLLLLAVVGSQVFIGCNATNTTKGGAIGAGVGGAIGGALGHRSDNTVVGAIIGATVGGAAGALIGRRMDKQAEELKRDLGGSTVSRELARAF